jgi:alpha-1,2-mannosyltransferase
MITTISPSTSVSWLTSRRLRSHGMILALCLWSLYIWSVATPGLRDRNGNLKGTDFLHFFTLGTLAAAHRGADLYDIQVQAALAAQRVPEAAGIRYLPLYPPQVSLFFAPLARLSYEWALLFWCACSAAIYGICCYGMWYACPNLRNYGRTFATLAIAFPAFFHLIAWGQTSAAALACFTAMFFLLRDRRTFLAGLVFGCLIFKPQLGLAGVVIFTAAAAWDILLGAAISAAIQLSTGVLYFGIQPLREWGRVIWNLQAVLPMLEPKPYQTHSLRTFWSMLIPWPALSLGLYLLSTFLILGMTIACWKNERFMSLSLKYSALLLASVLVAPHMTVYDLVILAPALILLADWLVAQPHTRLTRWMEGVLYLIYVLPLFGPVSRWTHVQLSVIAMMLMVYLIWRIARAESGGLNGANNPVGS